MKRFFLFGLIVLSCVGVNEFLVEPKKNVSVKEAQETLCSLRVDIMRQITDIEIKMSFFLKELALMHDQLQEDFFSFATGEKDTILSSKDKRLLQKKVDEAFELKAKLGKVQLEIGLFLSK